MNIIRTPAMELDSIPAIAYKQKLASGGAGLRILRLDNGTAGVFTLNKRDGSATAYGPVDEALFPDEAVEEAIELTEGLPYSARGKIKAVALCGSGEKEPGDVTEDDAPDAVDMVNSDEYAAIVDRYSDEKGKLNHRLMNKDFIQFAARSKTVQNMAADLADEESILTFIVKSRATMLANKKESLPDNEVALLMETLDEIDSRGAFKELKAYVRRILGRHAGRGARG